MRTNIFTSFTSPVSTETILPESRLAWTVSKRPISFMGNDGNQIQIPNKVAIVRDDSDAVLSVMSPSYQEIQNEQLLEFASTVFTAAEGRGDAPKWVGGGTFDGGKKVFFQAEVSSSLFLDGNPEEEVRRLVLFLNAHDGSHALMAMTTPVRVVCQNSLNAAIAKGSKGAFKVYHRKGMMAKVEEAVRILGLCDTYWDDFQGAAKKLMESEASASYVEQFLQTLMPATAEEEEVSTRTESRREEISTLFRNGLGNKGQSKWDLWNAVTEWVDHHQPSRVTQGRLNNSSSIANLDAELRLARAGFGAGARLKQEALDLLLA